ncbi:hypothetical protein FRB99_006542 [Tulasnella sp. 403]|nr:hypothetical protein FRB99_006542 [Tulasnella sp. 403]
MHPGETSPKATEEETTEMELKEAESLSHGDNDRPMNEDHVSGVVASDSEQVTEQVSDTEPDLPKPSSTPPSRRKFVTIHREYSSLTSVTGGEELLKAMRDSVTRLYIIWEKGFCHRDVCPDTLMFYREKDEFHPVLADWGLSKPHHQAKSGKESG